MPARRRAREQDIDVGALRLTPVRRGVLSILARERKCMGAYDLLAIYERETGKRTAAHTIYRTLRSLIEAGVVVHLPSTRTFVLRTCDRTSAVDRLYLVCVRCGNVAEREDLAFSRAMAAIRQSIQFQPTRAVEIEGLCKRCQYADVPKHKTAEPLGSSRGARARSVFP
jgi:Fur family zinc uptake transcriptional regulator